MATIAIVVGAAIMYAYLQRFPMDRLVGFGIAGFVAGLVIFGAQVAVADQPKVPCWSEMHGGAQFFRAMPYLCQYAPTPR
jgi:hypothetical protein